MSNMDARRAAVNSEAGRRYQEQIKQDEAEAKAYGVSVEAVQSASFAFQDGDNLVNFEDLYVSALGSTYQNASETFYYLVMKHLEEKIGMTQSAFDLGLEILDCMNNNKRIGPYLKANALPAYQAGELSWSGFQRLKRDLN